MLDKAHLFFIFNLLLVCSPISASYNSSEGIHHHETVYNLQKDDDSDEKIYTQKGSIQALGASIAYEIHFPRTHLDYAQRVKDVLEQSSPKLLEYFKWLPKEAIQIIIDTNERTANGSATFFPTNTIVLYDYPPQAPGVLDAGKDWPTILVLHELTHIIHMDMTNGFLAGIRGIFGSIGKLGGIVPRWFSEGIAVWAESEFTNQGRLRRPGLRHDFFHSFVFDEKSCRTIDCLDDPGVYPGRGYAYWAGGFFMEYLEQKKSGTMRCLLNANSRRFPFFLNRSFMDCTGLTASQNFNEFFKKSSDTYRQQIEEIKELKISKLFNTQVKETKGRIDDYKHSILRGQYYYFFEEDKDLEYLIKYDLKNGRGLSLRAHDAIQGIYSSPTMKSPYVQLFDPAHGDFSRRLQYLVGDTFQKEQLPDADYYFPLSKKQYLLGQYKRSGWRFYLANKGEKSLKEKRSYFTLPSFLHFSSPIQLSPGHIGFLTNFGEEIGFHSEKEKFYYAILDIKNKSIRLAYESSSPLQYRGKCGNDIILQGQLKDQADLITFNWKKKSKAIKYESAQLKELSELKISFNYSIAKFLTPSMRPQIFKGKCKKLLQEMKKISRTRLIQAPETPQRLILSVDRVNRRPSQQELINDLKAKEEKLVTTSTSYPDLRHFRPHYWFLSFSAGQNLSSLDVFTSINDPLARHNFSLQGSHYFQISKTAPSISYTYNRNDWTLGGNYVEFYTSSSLRESPDKTEIQSAFLSKSFRPGSFTLSPFLSFSHGNSADFLSQREFLSYGFGHSLVYTRTFADDFAQLLTLDARGFYQQTRADEDFYGFEAKFVSKWSLHRDFQVELNSSHGRLYTDDLRSGSLFGGGGSSDLIGRSIFHENYSISFSDAFGNNITTGHLSFNYMLTNSHRGSDLLPFFNRGTHLVLGGQYLKSQRLFIDLEIRADEEISNVFGGVRINSTLFYFARADIDFLLVKIIDKDVVIDNDIRPYLQLKASF